VTNDVIDIMVQLFVVYIGVLCISFKDSLVENFVEHPQIEIPTCMGVESKKKRQSNTTLVYDIFVNPTLIRITHFK
jgi:hypothetical protein